MNNNINRRSFIKQSAFLSAAIVAGTSIIPEISDAASDTKLDLSVVKGDDYFASTLKSIEMLGGIKKFVSKGAKVGLLVNSRYDKPGTYVKPEITLAVIRLCKEAGAKEIISLENVDNNYWRGEVKKKYADEIASVKNPGWNFKKVKIPGAVALKEAEVQPDFIDCDAFMNIAIFKDHEGIKITGTLKNLMGLTGQNTNKFFHFGLKSGNDWYADPDLLAQCIADINLLKKPVLCIGDATEFITTNGPFGPGNVSKQKKVIAATNTVTIDSYGAKVLGFKGNEILAVKKAYDLGLGEWQLNKIKSKELSV